MKRLLLLLAVGLAGCAGGPFKSAPPSAVAPQQERIAALTEWRVDGRVAIQRGEEGWSAKLRWQREEAGFKLRLIAPLGRGTYELSGDNGSVKLLAPNGGSYTASDAQALMSEHLGWSIPLEGAEYWIRGVVAPHATPANVRRDESGQVRDLDQAGWRISVLRRMQVGAFQLPAKLFLTYRDLKVRIVISSWKLAP